MLFGHFHPRFARHQPRVAELLPAVFRHLQTPHTRLHSAQSRLPLFSGIGPMSSPHAANQPTHADREKRWVALTSLLAAILLTSTKLVVGIATNSLGILSEALHSGLDLVAAAVTLWAVRVSSRPADREHTYGHGKIENLSALFETLLLLLTCVWIIYEAVYRLFFSAAVEVDPSVWAFIIVGGSIAIDYSRSRALRRVAIKYSSQALEADALHFSTDIWSSLVVFCGLLGVLAAEQFNLQWLMHADAVAALGVALIVVWVSLQLGRKSIDDLLDRIPRQLRTKALLAARKVPGVEGVGKIRLRRSGPEVFVDVTLYVGRAAAFEQAHEIADRAEAAVRAVLPGADMVVHVEPVESSDEDLTTTIRVLATRHGLGAHAIRIYEDERRRSVELHLEVKESLTLEEAHAQVTQFERELRLAVPGLRRIVSHIEPAGDSSAILKAEPAGKLRVEAALAEFVAAHPGTVKPHDVQVQLVGKELAVSLHWALAPSTAITDAHEFTVRLEDHLRARVKHLGRVVIHVEPQKPRGG
jgi:cation diffusion facilitator family transporter